MSNANSSDAFVPARGEDKAKLLIVEDEEAIRVGLADVFVYHGFEVDLAEEGHKGLAMASSGHYDLIVLDVMLPGVDGFTICEQIRRVDRDQPIIMLTAKSADTDIVQGLTLGADDYVAKPFSVAQLVARVKAVLRRARGASEQAQTIALGQHMRIDVRNLSGSSGDEPVPFTRREMETLVYLHAHRARPVARDELLHKVWGYDKHLEIETRTVDIHIAKLRRKIEPEPSKPRYLITVRGAGYRLDVEGEGLI